MGLDHDRLLAAELSSDTDSEEETLEEQSSCSVKLILLIVGAVIVLGVIIAVSLALVMKSGNAHNEPHEIDEQPGDIYKALEPAKCVAKERVKTALSGGNGAGGGATSAVVGGAGGAGGPHGVVSAGAPSKNGIEPVPAAGGVPADDEAALGELVGLVTAKKFTFLEAVTIGLDCISTIDADGGSFKLRSASKQALMDLQEKFNEKVPWDGADPTGWTAHHNPNEPWMDQRIFITDLAKRLRFYE